MLSYKIFKVSNLTQPFKHLNRLNQAIEEKINDMIYQFLDIETYNNPDRLNELKQILDKNNKHFILNFQCIITPPPELNKYNIHETIWNINVLVD